MGHADGTIAELTDFRRSLHQCLSPWGDALFELCDAALCSSAVNISAVEREFEFDDDSRCEDAQSPEPR
jgi:hypothetical protein